MRLAAGVLAGWALDHPVVIVDRASGVLLQLVTEVLGGGFGLSKGPEDYRDAVPREERLARSRGAVRDAAHDVVGHDLGVSLAQINLACPP